MFSDRALSPNQVQLLPLRLLAHLGDAVLHLFEREREILSSTSAQQLHKRAANRVSASRQAVFLENLESRFTEKEQDVVRRARNLKLAGYRKVSQSVYRKATAFEALIGYLYLTDRLRLREVLDWTADAE